MRSSDFFEGIGNNFKRTLNIVRGCVMIDHESYPVFNTCHGSIKCIGFYHFGIEAFVECPPDVFEDFVEIFGILFWSAHSTGQCRIHMMMTANKGLGDVFACAILDNKRVIVRNVVDETDFPVYTFFDKDMR